MFIRGFLQLAGSWRYRSSMQIMTLLVLVSCFSVVTGILTLTNNLYRVLTLWGESMQVNVYLAEDISESQHQQIQQQLQRLEKIENLSFVSKDAAIEEFSQQMASYAPDLLRQKDLLKYIPASFQFSLQKTIDPQAYLKEIEGISQQVRSLAGVEEVAYGQEWVKSFAGLIRNVTWIGNFLSLVIIIAAAFVMANAIHSSVYHRKDEVEVLELLGASTHYIRGPYLIEGAIIGFVSCLLSLGIGYILFAAIKSYFSQQVSLLRLSSHLQFLSLSSIFALLFLASVVGAFASYFCVRKINSGWAASQTRPA